MAVRIGPNGEILRDGAVGGGSSTNMWWLAVAAAVILFGTNPDSDAFVEYAQVASTRTGVYERAHPLDHVPNQPT